MPPHLYKPPKALPSNLNFHSSTIATMADKLRTQQQLEQLQARFVGTGHADTTKFEWSSNVHRDTYASYVGHPPLMSYMAIGMNEPAAKLKARFIERMIQPVGPPPEKEE